MTEGTQTPKNRGRIVTWVREHLRSLRTRVLNLDDTPHSVALGLSIGLFFGFTPLFGLKTLLGIVIAWICRSNKVAAAIGVTLHDLVLPAMPAILLWEYKMGMWVLHGSMPHHPLRLRALRLREYMEWTTFFTLGQPMLIGAVLFGIPIAVPFYFVVRTALARARAKLIALPVDEAPVA
jgi:uncharacterized protein (DUF2062 family)